MPTLLVEETPLVEARGGKTGSRLLVQIITPGRGSSGFYTEEVLKQAAKDKVFRSGTHMFIDHPTESEKWERPARSVRDLAAVLAGDAYWNGSALVAEAYVFEPYRAALKDKLDAIGTSIRATAEGHQGKVEGYQGLIIDRLIEAQSVDFVTRAGRGGKILQVLESAQQQLVDAVEARNLGQWLESRLHQHFTMLTDDLAADGHMTREERVALSAAIGDALTAFAEKVEGSQPHLYQRDPFAEPGEHTAPAEEADPIVPATRSDGTTTEESKEDTMGKIQIDEADHTALVEKAGRVDALESERDREKTRAEEAESNLAAKDKELEEARASIRPSTQHWQDQIAERDLRIATLEAEKAAAPVIAEALSEAFIGEAVKTRLGNELLEDLPLSENNTLDEHKLTARVEKHIRAAETEAAELLKAAGIGAPRGLGAVQTPATEAAAAEYDDSIKGSLGRAFGLSESATEIAVKGR